MAELLFQHVLPNKILLAKTDNFDVQKNVKKRSRKVKKGPEPPKIDFVCQQQTGKVGYEAKNAGVQKFSSFIWTFVVTKEK